MPPPILVINVDRVVGVGIGVAEAPVGVAKIVLASVVGWVDVSYIDARKILGTQRHHNLQVVAFDNPVITGIVERQRGHWF